MSNMLTDTMHAAEQGMKSAKKGTMHALETAKDDLDSAKKSTLHALGTERRRRSRPRRARYSTFRTGSRSS